MENNTTMPQEVVAHAELGEAFISSYLSEDSDYLAHYGVKGMKWGQHIFGKVKTGAKKAGMKTAELTKAGYKKANTAYKLHQAEKEAKKAAKKAAKRAKITDSRKLTDEELVARIKRLELEQSYQKLISSTEPDYVSSGKKVVKDIMENSLKNIGGQTVTYMLGAGVNKAAKTFFDGITDDIINPKKGQKDK